MNYQALCDPVLTYSPIFARQDRPLVNSLSSPLPLALYSIPSLFLFPVYYSVSLESEVQSQIQRYSSVSLDFSETPMS